MERRVMVVMAGGSTITCRNLADAELVRKAERAHFNNQKPPQEALAALSRAGLNEANSPFYRSIKLKLQA